jgi:tryptophan synthase alpha chain
LSRIDSCIKNCQAKNRKLLVPYIVAGDPVTDFTVPMMHELVKQGADIVELGVPFSDPMAEGPVIQLAHERALAHHITLKAVLAMVKDFRQTNQQTPVVLMGYANPIAKMGFQTFATTAADAGVDGLLLVDMPPEEAGELNQALKAVKINNIFLIAPTTTDDRIKSIAAAASGYLYYVSVKGVTGAGHLDIDSVRQKLEKIKSITDLPVTVGFGIKDAQSAAAIAQLAEGVVVGSELIKHIVEAVAYSNDIASQTQAAAQLIEQMRTAIDA